MSTTSCLLRISTVTSARLWPSLVTVPHMPLAGPSIMRTNPPGDTASARAAWHISDVLTSACTYSSSTGITSRTLPLSPLVIRPAAPVTVRRRSSAFQLSERT